MRRPFFLAILCLFATPLLADQPRILRETRDDRHVAIVGDGFLRAEADDGTIYLLRSCELAENRDGTLCASVDGKLLPLDPRIGVSNHASKILISPCGEVSAIERNAGKVEIGMLPMFSVRHREGIRELSNGVFVCEEGVILFQDLFGERSQAFLMQGWIDGPPASAAE